MNGVDPFGLFKLHFAEGVSTADQEFIGKAFAEFHNQVLNNQNAIDYYNLFGIGIVKDSTPCEGPDINIGVDKSRILHGEYLPAGNRMMFYQRAFISATRAKYTIGHELGHWARFIYAMNVNVSIYYPIINPDWSDDPYGYSAEKAVFGNIMWPDGTLR